MRFVVFFHSEIFNRGGERSKLQIVLEKYSFFSFPSFSLTTAGIRASSSKFAKGVVEMKINLFIEVNRVDIPSAVMVNLHAGANSLIDGLGVAFNLDKLEQIQINW